MRPLTRLGPLWERVRDSLWFLPGLMSLAAALGALLCARLDQLAADSELRLDFLYHGDAEGARALLSTVAGSMITVAGVSFSATMVALSLTSSQLGPRLLSNFMRDRGNQVVLGGFIATFLFCLLALGSAVGGDGRFVSVSATVALMLASASLLLLIYFIHHIASSMQADHVIQTVSDDVGRCLRRIFPTADVETWDADAEPFPEDGGAPVAASSVGYLQGVDEAALVEIARAEDVHLRVLRRPGHYLGWGTALVQVVGRDAVDAGLERDLRQAFIVGGRRTADQDPEYGILQLVEIALRALSPGINDAFTAMTCIDHLGGILSSIAGLPERSPIRRDDDGRVRLLLDPIDFAGVLEAAFNQIRQNAAGQASVSIRLLEALALIAGATREPQRLAAIGRQAEMVYGASAGALAEVDRAALDERHAGLRHAIAADDSGARPP